MSGIATGVAGVVGGAAAKGATSTLVKSFVEKVVAPYFAGRAAKVEMVEHVKAYLRWLDQRTKYVPTIAIQGGVFPLDDIYEPLTICAVDGSGAIEISEYPAGVFEKNRCIVIVDSAGMGKSTITKFILRSSLTEMKKIPVLVELRRLKAGGSILELIFSDIVKSGKESLVASNLISAIRDGNFVFFLDGYDEIQDDLKASVSEEIVRITSDFQYCNFILTSREEMALSGFPEFFWYQIAKLTPEKALSLLRRYDRNRGVADRLWAKASGMKGISDFLQTPLLLTLLYKAFDYKSVVPMKKATFFRQVFDALYQDHDLSKEGFYERRKKSSLDLDDFHKVMRRVGLASVKKGEVQFSPEEFHELISKALKDSSLSSDPSKLKSDLISAVPIFIKDGNDFRWSHKSFADYFAAKCIWLDLGSERDAVVTAMFDSARCEKYIAVLQVIAELDEGLVFDGRVYEFLREIYPKNQDDDAQLKFYLAAVNAVARIYLIPGNFSMENSVDTFHILHEKVVAIFPSPEFEAWRISWLEGAVIFVERNKKFSQLNVIGELIGRTGPYRGRRYSKDFYSKFKYPICLNEYLDTATGTDREEVLAIIRSAMHGVRVPAVSSLEALLTACEARRSNPVAIGGDW